MYKNASIIIQYTCMYMYMYHHVLYLCIVSPCAILYIPVQYIAYSVHTHSSCLKVCVCVGAWVRVCVCRGSSIYLLLFGMKDVQFVGVRSVWSVCVCVGLA